MGTRAIFAKVRFIFLHRAQMGSLTPTREVLTGRFFWKMACKAGPRRGGGGVDVGGILSGGQV